MRRLFPFVAAVVAAWTLQVLPGLAQTNLTMLGGATGADVYCLQAGDLNNGVFVGTYFQTGPGSWEEHLKAGTFKFQERKRDQLATEIFDNARAAAVQFDFVSKTIKFSTSNPPVWTERYIILSATNQAASKECLELAKTPGTPGGPPPPPGAGTPAQNVTFPPRTPIVLAPGTPINAFQGPACPAGFGNPGDMLCPGKKSCHPPGTFCMPLGGFCPPGTFGEPPFGVTCVPMGDPRLCPLTPATMQTGIIDMCPVGLRCAGPNPALPCIP